MFKSNKCHETECTNCDSFVKCTNLMQENLVKYSVESNYEEFYSLQMENSELRFSRNLWISVAAICALGLAAFYILAEYCTYLF